MLVIVFLYAYALPQYSRYTYEVGVEFADSLPWPSMIISLLTSATVTAITNPTATYSYANGSYANCTSTLQFHDGNLVPAFDPLLLSSENQYAALNDRLYINFNVTCMRSYLSQLLASLIRILVNSSISSSQSVAGSWFLEFADPRVTYDAVLDCNRIITSQIAPVIADLSVSFDVQQIIDSYGRIHLTKKNDSNCASEFPGLLTNQSRPYLIYTPSIVPSPLVETRNCVDKYEAQQQCSVTIILQMGSRFLRSTKTIPGIAIVDIWLNIGAIVGGVQFFAWILNGR